MQIVIVGNGRMGRAVAALAAERGHAVRVIGREENAGGVALTPKRLAGVDMRESVRGVVPAVGTR